MFSIWIPVLIGKSVLLPHHRETSAFIHEAVLVVKGRGMRREDSPIPCYVHKVSAQRPSPDSVLYSPSFHKDEPVDPVFLWPVRLDIHTFCFLSHGDPAFEVSKHQCTLRLTHTHIRERNSTISILQQGKQGTGWFNNLLIVRQQINFRPEERAEDVTLWSPTDSFRAFPVWLCSRKKKKI